MGEIRASLDVFDYSGNKLCGLYDSQNSIIGQAYDITFSQNMKDGIHELKFKIPYMLDMPYKNTKAWRSIIKKTWGEVRQNDWGFIRDDIENNLNFRWRYLKSEYIIRLYYNGETQWYIAKKPQKSKSNKEIVGTVICKGIETTLKTKNIYMEFDDENGIGTADELLDKILAGTDWSRGETDPIYEKDGVTEKIRSLTSGDKQGALGLIVKLCNLFKCYPVFDSDRKKVLLRNFNNRTQVLEGTVGNNLDALTVNYDSDDIITRLYVEGEYGDNGYVGIDSVNPTGLNYILNFDYYREIGVMTAEQEDALSLYLEKIKAVKEQISVNQAEANAVEDNINNAIGQCMMVLYYDSSGTLVLNYVYGNVPDGQKTLNIGDKVVVLNSNGTFRYETIETTAEALLGSGDYGITKFVTGAAGQIGAKEVSIEAKEKEIEELNRKIASTTKPDKIAEYTAEIERLQIEIQSIYNGSDGLYAMMDSVMRFNGLIQQIKTLNARYEVLSAQQDEIEADFIIAMGDLLKDGYWPCNDYVPGQEQSFYDDAVERLKVLSRPKVGYQFSFQRVMEDFNIPMEDIVLNGIFRINDDDLEVYDNTFITDITIGVDDISNGTIAVSNNDITISNNDLGSLLSRMSQLADLIDQRNAMYDRAKAISKNGTFFADRLEGQINVLTNQIMSTVSNWYTDDRGNIMFLSEDGGSAMMLSGAGWMIASSKDDDGNWIWRTAATGEGLTADVITAGFISAERIESGSISTNKLEPNVGNSLVISGNPSITKLNDQIGPEFSESNAYAAGDMVMKDGNMYVFIVDHPAGAWDPADVLQTNVTSQIELLPDKIITIVAQKGYSKTYVSDTDPALDPTNEVRPGDYWVKPNAGMGTWQNVLNKKWSEVKASTWYDVLNKVADTYCRQGTGADAKWVPVYDTAIVSEAFTRIEQTKDMILQEAYRANAAEGELDSKITQTADSIRQDVARSYLAKTADYATVDSIIDEAISLADAAATSAKNASIAKTTRYQDADSIVDVAVAQAATSAGELYIAKTVQYQTADAIVTEAERYTSNQLTNYYTKTETASEITTKMGAYTYSKDDLYTKSDVYTKTETASQITTSLSSYTYPKSDLYTKTDVYTKTETASQISTSLSSYTYPKSDLYTKTNVYTKTETASQISTSLSSYTYPKSDLYTKNDVYTKTETASQISTSLSSYTYSKDSLYTKTDLYTKTETASQISTSLSSYTYSKSDVYTKTETASQITTSITSNNQNYYTKTETATQISTYVGNNAYGKVSGITINADGVAVTGSKYITLESAGYVQIGECFFQQNGFRYEKVVGSTYRYASVLVDSLGGLGIKSDLSTITITPNMEVGTYRGAAMFHKENEYVVFSGDGEKPDGTNYTKVSLGYGSDAQYQIDQAVIKYIYWVNHCGQLSSREIKHNIRNIETVSDKIRALNPVRFVYNNDEENTEQVGLIYEDTVDILPEVCFEHDGQKAVDYVKLVPFLLKEVQRLQDEVKKLKE